MVGDYAIIKNPTIHSEDEEIPEYIVDKVKYELRKPKEIISVMKPTYINKKIIKQILGEKNK